MLDDFQEVYWVHPHEPCFLFTRVWQATVSPNLNPGFPQRLLRLLFDNCLV